MKYPKLEYNYKVGIESENNSEDNSATPQKATNKNERKCK